jgi:hypothetical protein
MTKAFEDKVAILRQSEGETRSTPGFEISGTNPSCQGSDPKDKSLPLSYRDR